uniref:TM2 domain-containing protein n=1 Tax=Panagrellus redivivus TaxID=6233 RepID=A0A7E4VYW8_PANRE
MLRLTIVSVFLIAFCAALKNCNDLKKGQYICETPVIDAVTNKFTTCAEDNSISVKCKTIPGLKCRGKNDKTGEFIMKIENACRYNTHVKHVGALLLSVFLGVLGIDRFYLGHFTIGLFKLCSCGFFMLLYVADIIFIALKIITPADGSHYVVSHHEPHIASSTFLNETSMLLYNCFNCIR